MFYYLNCAYCGKGVFYDTSEELYDDATRYWKADKDKMIEVYCDAKCSLLQYEKRRPI